MSAPRKKCPWTVVDCDTLRRLYSTTDAAEIARVLGRTDRAVYTQAKILGLAKNPHIKVDRKLLNTIKRLNAQGYPDSEIACELDLCRKFITRQRVRLGLPSQARSDRYRDRVREKVKADCEAKGLRSLAEVRAMVMQERAAALGWPADLRMRAVQILEALDRYGPMTREQLCRAIGMEWHGTRSSLKSSDREGSYLARLIALGLVVDLGRLVRLGGKGANRHVYSLALEAERSWEGTREHA